MVQKKSASNVRRTRVDGAGQVVAHSTFHPQQPLFASTIGGLEAHRIRIHHTTTGKLTWEFELEGRRQTPSVLRWGTLAVSRKRRRSTEGGAAPPCLAIGTSSGQVVVVGTEDQSTRMLEGHTDCVTDVQFAGDRCWSLSRDRQLYEWDVSTQTPLNTYALQQPSPQRFALLSDTSLLLASHQVCITELPSMASEKTSQAHASPIHSMVAAAKESNHFLTAAQDDRFVNVHGSDGDVQLVADAAVVHVAVAEEILAAVTSEGGVDVFLSPWSKPSAKTKKRTKTADSLLAVEDGEVLATAVDGDVLLLAILRHGTAVEFERVKWKEVERLVVLPRRALQEEKHANGVAHYNEASTRVAEGHDTSNMAMDMDETNEGSDVEPSMGERLAALERPVEGRAKAPSARSLGTILAQALHTNDNNLLETCLHQTDSDVVLATIKRLPPALSPLLLERIAERMARKPNRAALGVWIRWCVVVHGGQLTSMPSLKKSIASLLRTLTSRAAMLPNLLALQGRLDMLSAQMEIRQTVDEEEEDMAAVYIEPDDVELEDVTQILPEEDEEESEEEGIDEEEEDVDDVEEEEESEDSESEP